MSMFTNKVVVITGAGSGIGRALAQCFAERGAQLALSDVSAKGLAETKKSLPKGTRVKTYTLDVSKKAAVFKHANDVQRDFGTAHYVINNAGTSMTGTFDHLTVEEIEWQLGINLWGVIYGSKAFLPMFLEQREGCIVNISSVFGLVGFPTQSAYNISKFGVRGLTECLWSELDGTGVRAVCVHPGGIKTNIDKGGRVCAAAGKEEAFVQREAPATMQTSPEDCAADIVAGIERGDLRIVTGHRSATTFWLSRVLPNHYSKILKLLTGYAPA
jgi:short-subunit dehydrogenase